MHKLLKIIKTIKSMRVLCAYVIEIQLRNTKRSTCCDSEHEESYVKFLT